MKLVKILITGLLVPALASPALATAVRPSIKPVVAPPAKQDRSLVVRSSARAGAELEDSNSLIGLPLLFIVGGLAAAAVVAVAVSAAIEDEPASPGS